MKVSKLIIPLLGISSINNANNQISQTKVMQLEKEINPAFYEVMSEINLNNYSTNDILVNKKVSESLVQEIQDKAVLYSNTHKNEVGKPIKIPTPEQCMQALQAALATCALLGPFLAPSCVTAAWLVYAACMLNNN